MKDLLCSGRRACEDRTLGGRHNLATLGCLLVHPAPVLADPQTVGRGLCASCEVDAKAALRLGQWRIEVIARLFVYVLAFI